MTMVLLVPVYPVIVVPVILNSAIGVTAGAVSVVSAGVVVVAAAVSVAAGFSVVAVVFSGSDDDLVSFFIACS